MELEGLEPSPFRLPAGRSGQLSYSPSEAEVGSKVNARPLTIPGRRQTQVYRSTTRELLGWQQIAAVELAAVDGDQVELADGVRRPHVAASACTGGLQVDLDRRPTSRSSAPHLHWTRSSRPPISNARSNRPCSVIGRSTGIPRRTAAAAISASAIAPFSFEVRDTNVCSHPNRTGFSPRPPAAPRPRAGPGGSTRAPPG